MDYRVLKCWKLRKSRWQDRIFIKFLKGTDFLIFEEIFKNKGKELNKWKRLTSVCPKYSNNKNEKRMAKIYSANVIVQFH